MENANLFIESGPEDSKRIVPPPSRAGVSNGKFVTAAIGLHNVRHLSLHLRERPAFSYCIEGCTRD
jgi:hypothetical protein